MQNYTVEIKTTNKPSILKFEFNEFLTKQKGYEYHNIEDAMKSPIASQLFYLPFVKTVYISQNFIAIEKFNIVEWADVQDEVSEQLLKHLNDGGKIVDEKEEDSVNKVPVTVYAESTPNPSVMKFVANKKLVLESAEFKSIDDAELSPLAQKLFHFPFVKEIFMDENYISINKYDMAEWELITNELRGFIKDYIEEGGKILESGKVQSGNTEAPSPKIDTSNLDDISKEIVQILEEYVKPAVASDGGNIMFKSYNTESKDVQVILQGACSGCPSSTITLKNGIETMLKEMLQGKVNSVTAFNG
ncbi:NifU family protein [Psychroflexus gondwanensis]|jgi:Fe-S cluster biogenesis protein NfuA|uniref:Iron-sulfur cluster assembly protein NifU-like protein n=1 Tax=Psychroflexus gondwanensis ACAM 44 TaxID=1189619 RepID=N1WU15_9FLAO|nr:NifU family protein [Psychroflexus gondwanensis]EMY82485.1 iron-sulfur cluster assembly protein NifU-like protein [Psychroflexus gondwanensis ACAM 44]TXE21292.1 NifU family protein [Psychroflexus gondwanensis]